jgi:hypothetical protein
MNDFFISLLFYVKLVLIVKREWSISSKITLKETLHYAERHRILQR